MKPPELPTWALAAKPDDFGLLGQESDNAQQTLQDLANSYEIDLQQVTDCLLLLREHGVVLHIGLPRVMIAYSPACQAYRACFDGDLASCLSAINEAQAGIWLTVAMTELGKLPTTPDDWGVIRIVNGQPVGRDVIAVRAYVEATDPDAEAFWNLARFCQGGR